jgi:transcriptional regulator with XRE-family HTH domain
MYKRIRDLREDRDLTQQAIANYINVNQTTYSRYESGVLDIPTSIIRALAVYHNTSVDYLLDLTDDPKPYRQKHRR